MGHPCSRRRRGGDLTRGREFSTAARRGRRASGRRTPENRRCRPSGGRRAPATARCRSASSLRTPAACLCTPAPGCCTSRRDVAGVYQVSARRQRVTGRLPTNRRSSAPSRRTSATGCLPPAPGCCVRAMCCSMIAMRCGVTINPRRTPLRTRYMGDADAGRPAGAGTCRRGCRRNLRCPYLPLVFCPHLAGVPANVRPLDQIAARGPPLPAGAAGIHVRHVHSSWPPAGQGRRAAERRRTLGRPRSRQPPHGGFNPTYTRILGACVVEDQVIVLTGRKNGRLYGDGTIYTVEPQRRMLGG